MTSPHSAAFDAWINRARGVPIETEIKKRNIKLKPAGAERVGACPKCGGEDRFAINVAKQLWNCRHCDKGGDVIDLVMFLDACDFVHAGTTLAGEPPATLPYHVRRLGNGKNARAGKEAGRPAGEKGRNFLPSKGGEPIEELIISTPPNKIVAARFDYTDEGGNLLFQVERVEWQNPDGSFVVTADGKRKKTFRQRRPDPQHPGEWLWNVAGVAVVPYRLPELLEAIGNGYLIVIAEGEAKVDLLASWNVPATCCAGGAKKWTKQHVEFFRDADVIILPDNDVPGREHADSVAASLQNVAASIRIINLPGLPPKGDVVDWALAGGTVEQLIELIEEAKPWTPGKAKPPRKSGNLEDQIALGFAAEYAGDLRYVALWNRWMQWRGNRWQHEDTLRAFDLARALCRASGDAKAKTVAAVVTLARTDRAIAGREHQWDIAVKLFNTPTKETTR